MINGYKAAPLTRFGVIFPQQLVEEHFPIELPAFSINIAKNTLMGFVPVLRGAIKYDYPGSAQPHFTTFHVHIVKVQNRTASSGWHPIPTDKATTIQASDLFVTSQIGETEAT